MTQTTVKSVNEALAWIHGNEHHDVGWEWANGRSKETGLFELGEETHLVMKSRQHKLRIPKNLARMVWKYIEPNRRPFDTRMYALTKTGKRRLYRYLYSHNPRLPSKEARDD